MSAARLALAAAALASLAPAVADGFVRSRGNPTGGTPGPELTWCTRQPSFVVNEKGSRNAGPTASIEAVRRSFTTWTTTGCSDLSFEDQGTTARADVGFDENATDNQNLVVWREVTCDQVVPRNDPCLSDGGCNDAYDCWDHEAQAIALTTTSFDNVTGQILDADIELNGAGFTFTTVDSPVCVRPPVAGANDCVATDIQNTVTHEVGHFIGLAHSPDQSSTMFASESFGETSKRELSSDDVDGVCSIYPKGGSEPASCPGTLQGPSGNGGSGGGGGCTTGGGTDGIPSLISALTLVWALRRRRGPHPTDGGCPHVQG